MLYICAGGTKLCFHCQALAWSFWQLVYLPFNSFARFLISRRIRFYLLMAQRVNCCCEVCSAFFKSVPVLFYRYICRFGEHFWQDKFLSGLI